METRAGEGEFSRGWPIVLTSAVGFACGVSPILFFTIGAFSGPLAKAFGWSRGQIYASLTVMDVAAVIGAPLVGWLIPRLGLRRVTLISVLGLGAGLLALGLFSVSLPVFYGLVLLASVAGAGTLSVSWSKAVNSWFDRKRGLALGIGMMGSGLYSTFAPSYVTWLIDSYGWRAGFYGLAALPLLLSFPLALFLFFERPEDEAEEAADGAQKPSELGLTFGEAVRTRAFWLMGIGIWLANFGTAGLIAHSIPIMTDAGVSKTAAAGAAGATGLAIIVARVGVGYLLDVFWAPLVAAVALMLPVFACVLLWISPDVQTGTIAAGLVGLAAGAEYDLLAFLASRYFGLRSYGMIYGVLFAIYISAHGFAAPIFGAAFDATGSYRLVLLLAGAGFLVGPPLFLLMGRYPKFSR